MTEPENTIEESILLDSEFDESDTDIRDIAYHNGIAISFRSSDDESW